MAVNGPEKHAVPEGRRAMDPSTPPALQEVDERWTIPWAVVDGASGDRRAAAEMCWHEASPDLEIAGFDIPRPMLYTSEGAAASGETSCIDTTLPVERSGDDPVEPVPHWASYASLTPRQRGAYLAWLASGRTAPLGDINYAFLYFYGLERRALMEKGEPEAILRVLMRLLRQFEDAPAFFSSVSRFAAFLFATKGIEKLKPAWFERLFLQQTVPLHSDALSVAVTWLYERGKPLPARLALEIVRQDIRSFSHMADPDDVCAVETRFEAAYTETYGEGMPLRAAETPHTWKYRPLNPSLQTWQHFANLWSVTSSDVLGAYDQFQPLIDLWRSILPESTGERGWGNLIDAHANREGRVLVPVAKVAGEVGVAKGKKGAYSLAESQAIVDAAREAGFEVLPNPDVLLRPFKAKERVVLTRASVPHAESEPYYLAGTLLLALGTAMAEVDGDVDHTEVLHVSEIVNSLYHFNDFDKSRLGVLRRRLIKFPPKLSSLTRRVRAILSDAERVDVGKFLVGVAAANFQVVESERKALRRVYRALGIPVAELTVLLDELLEPAGETSAPRVRRTVLGRHMRETRAFAIQLGVAMQQVVPKQGPANDERGIWYVRSAESATTSSTEQAVERKADPYCDALYALVQRRDWTEAEFVALGERHGVYLPGGVGAMAGWAAEVAGEKNEGRLAIFEEPEN